MEIIKRSGRGYAQDPTKFLDFSRFADQGAENVALVEAAFEQAAGWEQFDLSEQELDRIKHKKVVRLEFEEPNKFFLGDDQNLYDGDFYKVFTLCPYTAEYLNIQQGVDRRVPIFFPFNEQYIPARQKKEIDIIYTGHIVSKHVLRDLKTISQFNYRLVSNSKHSLVTNKGASYEDKIDLISKSRVTLVHNLLYPRFYHLINIWRYSNWRDNKAFSQLPSPLNAAQFFINRSGMVVPQLKSRVFEAAFARSLILCKRDPFNVIERFFEPDKEFIYYEEGQLTSTLSKILADYDMYQPIVERAFERAQSEYTTTAFFNKYIRENK